MKMKDKKVLHTLIDDFALNFPKQNAIYEANSYTTYGELKTNSDSFSKLLLSHNLEKGMAVCLYLTKGTDYVTSLLAVNKAGGIFLPVEPEYPLLRSAFLINKAQPSFFVTIEGFENQLYNLLEQVTYDSSYKVVIFSKDYKKFSVVDREKEVCQIHLSSVTLPTITGDDSNYLLYTSGSTGKPKIIEGSHKSLSHFIHWEVNVFALDTSSRVSQLAPISFDVSLRDIFVPLLAGGMLIVPPTQLTKDPRRLLSWIVDEQISLMHIVPSLFRFLMIEMESYKEIKTHLESLKYVFLAGEALYGKDVEQWRSMIHDQTKLINLYGPSETTLAKIHYVIPPQNIANVAIVPLGEALPNTHILIMNEGVLCGTGAVGELYIKTPFRSKGYYKDPNLNNQSFIQNPLHNDFEDIVYKTGDLGKRNKEGFIEFVGRIDKQVKIRGNRIELGEIESYVRDIPKIKQVVVKAIRHKEELVIVCYYTSTDPIDAMEIQRVLDDYLPKTVQPGFYILQEEFPLNLNGKINQKELPLPEELLYLDGEYQPPMTYLEGEVSKIWATVLGLKRVSVTQSFFALGGHSLSSTRIISLIHKTLQKEISVKEFFDFPTVREQVQLLNRKTNTSFKDIPPAPKLDHYPLSHGQMRLWVQNEQSENKGLYNMPASCIISGDVKVDVLNEAFRILIARHESLRTSFDLKDGFPRQIIHSEVPFELMDLRGNSAFSSVHEIEEYLTQELNIPFYLNQAPLLRASVLPIEDGRNLLSFTIHHIVSDGWSTGIIIDEILKCYRSLVNNEIPSLPEITTTYKDYAVWHNNLYENEEHDSLLFWKNKLQNTNTPLSLPLDHPFTSRKKYSGKIIESMASQEVSDDLKKLVYQNDTSLFVICLAVLKVLLYKFHGQHNIAVGIPIAGRFHQDLENQIGMFLNYLVLNSTVTSEIAFTSFLESLRDEVFEALEHQAYPYDKLVDEIAPEVDEGRNPFYDVLMVMNNSELNGSQENLTALQEEMGAERIALFGSNSKVALTLFISDDPQVKINLEYSDELFSDATAKKIIDTYHILLKVLSKEPTTKIFEVIHSLSNDQDKNTISELSQETVKLINEEF